MAITIRNKETEAAIRKLGKRWGLGPSAVVRRLAENELARMQASDPVQPTTPAELWDDLMAIVPTFTEAEKRAVWAEMEHMYDYIDDDQLGADDGDRHVGSRRRLSAGS